MKYFSRFKRLIKRRNTRIYLLYLLILIIIGFFIAEITLRKISPPSVYKQSNMNYPSPYIEFTMKPGSELCIEDYCETVNSLGFRGDLPKLIKINEYRIFLLGGSVVHSTGSVEEKTLSKKIEKRLKENGLSNAKVYNFGMTSYNSAQELVLLTQ